MPDTPPALRLTRGLLVATGAVLVSIGGLYKWGGVDWVDPLAGRVSIGASALAVAVLTVASRQARRHALALTYAFFFLISTWQLGVAAASGLTSASAFGVILVLLGCSAGIQSRRLLLAYTVVFVGGAAAAAFWVETPGVPRGAFLATIAAIGVLGVFVAHAREAALDGLRAAREEALGAARAKSEFLATMSHEIRTPLNGVIGMTDLLEGTPLTDDQRDALGTIQASGRALLDVINDVLDFSKIEAGHLELETEPVDLRRFADDAVAVVAPAAAAKGVEVVCHVAPDVPTTVLADGTRLRQIVLNLLSNAVKFTDGGDVTLSVTARRRRGLSDVTLRVRDSGIGIAPEDQAVLFDSFTQVDASATRRFGGTGLGLAITKRLVEVMGGGVAVESALGEGAEFVVTVPLAEVEPAPRRGPPAGTLLVVDDHDGARKATAALGRALGFHVEAFATAAEAVGYVEGGGRYDLGAIDLTLPDDGAFGLAERLRVGPSGGRPLVLLAPLGAPPSAPALLDAVLPKPVRADRFADVVARLTGAAPAPPASAAPPAPSAPLRVLLVEDHEVNRQVAVGLLGRLGVEPDVAHDGAEALEAFEHGDYDLVLMDLQMPVMGGLEATRRLRAALPEARQPRVVALTANALTADVAATRAAGMDAFLSKPVRLEELKAELDATRGRPASAARDTPPPPGPAEPPVSPEATPEAVAAHLRALSGGDDALCREILDAYLRTEGVLAAELADPALAAEAAHKLKAAFATLGADALAHAAHTAERALRAGDPADLDALAEGLTRFRATVEAAFTALGHQAVADPAVADPAVAENGRV